MTYRKKAADLRQKAIELPTELLRRHALELARQYEAFADVVERQSGAVEEAT